MLGLALVLTGCTPTAEHADGRTTESGISAAQQALLDRDTIGFDEYKEAWSNYAQCLVNSDSGYRATNPTLDPISGRRYNWDLDVIPGAQFDNDAMQNCQVSELVHVDSEYVRQNPQRMDPALLNRVFAGLERAGVSYTGTETNYGDFFPNGNEDAARTAAVDAVLLDAARALYPEVTTWGYGY
ncbi:hypothetical protein M2390_000897 [Mycetocola sp. BIGb0189]|uniref:hypothetical protein n=1 Tax=Mycetocola sp. BIGb0189 TaxID=2940604 RepID=UPI002166F0D3|nr:hypothetical protein [Mycetocola sp. BIGb0189]MCS4275736.1 hypothetical protein [Mycetocola sp. BIGb0189]